MVVSLLYTPSTGYSWFKLLTFATVVITIIIPFIYPRFDVRRFVHGFVYLASLLNFVYTAVFPKLFASYMSFYQNREFVVKYLDIGYLSGLVILLAIFVGSRIKPWIRIPVIAVNFSALVISAARGPMIFFALVLVARGIVSAFSLFKKKWTFNKKNIALLVSGLVVVGAGFYYFLGRYFPLIERVIRRLSILFDPQSSSIAERLNQIFFSIRSIFENAANFIFGKGIGSFGIVYSGTDEKLYPHNVLLEIGFELGFIGIFLFVFLLFLYFKRIRFNLSFLAIFFYLLLNSLKSYSLVDSRIMFGVVGILFIMVCDSPVHRAVTMPHSAPNSHNQKLLEVQEPFHEKVPGGRNQKEFNGPKEGNNNE